MANDPKNIRLGPCRVRWAGVDLGLTKGGVQVELSTDTKKVTVDQFGNTAVNEYITGRTLTVKAPFAESDVDSLFNMMRYVGATLVDDGVKATGSVTFSAQPVANDTLTFNGYVFTFKATVAAAGDVKIGATQADSVKNLLLALQFCTDAKVAGFAFALSAANVISVAATTSGTGGNVTLAKTGTAMTTVNTTGGTASTRKRIEMGSGTGFSLLSNAKELVLRPYDKLDTDFSEDFIVPLAANSGGLQFAYQLDTERLLNLTFTGYPDPTTGLLFQYGDRR